MCLWFWVRTQIQNLLHLGGIRVFCIWVMDKRWWWELKYKRLVKNRSMGMKCENIEMSLLLWTHPKDIISLLIGRISRDTSNNPSQNTQVSFAVDRFACFSFTLKSSYRIKHCFKQTAHAFRVIRFPSVKQPLAPNNAETPLLVLRNTMSLEVIDPIFLVRRLRRLGDF